MQICVVLPILRIPVELSPAEVMFSAGLLAYLLAELLKKLGMDFSEISRIRRLWNREVYEFWMSSE